jgi:hypothetical protein
MDDVREELLGEFAGARLGDKRLSKRLETIARAVAADPAEAFPQVLCEAELEGFYRFVGNDSVAPTEILGPHRQATVARCAPRRTVVCVHDTSAFVYGTSREGLGDERRNTFRAHVGLAVAADETREPLGVLDLHTWARTEESVSRRRKSGKLTYAETRQLPREQDRWAAGVARCEAEIGDAAELVHVMDSEADDYSLIALLVADSRRFVIRLCSDRTLMQETPDQPRKLREQVKTFPVAYEVDVELGERRNSTRYPPKTKRSLPRAARTARLAVHVGSARFRAPRYGGIATPSMELGLVWARELDPPEGEEPVDWILATTEPLDTIECVRAVITYYRCRWIIEELFKALKSGCSIERRQLETYGALVNTLAVFLPIAWTLLRLRSLSRAEEPQAARDVLPPTQIEVLRLLVPTFASIAEPSARDALLAIAKVGGHLKHNGPPGWQVLGRGYLKLLELCRGFLLAARRCDQS